ncbi:hypothetical protein OG271_04010 [Micromonospora rifamycinica]|uniref:hypothetical protein n=1 Tax=Micromonospora rifamycinica TaxID=291594 RepID=UPI002E2C9A0E|nr:hypothetical protein [Micromonospora rifamycinica]
MGERIETGELKRLAVHLEEAAGVAPVEVRKVVQKGALNIKNDARRRVQGLRHAPAYPYAITYDSTETPGGAWADIGPDKDKRQGALGNILEYGTVKNAPIPHMGPAGDAERPRFERALEDLAVRLLEGR